MTEQYKISLGLIFVIAVMLILMYATAVKHGNYVVRTNKALTEAHDTIKECQIALEKANQIVPKQIKYCLLMMQALKQANNNSPYEYWPKEDKEMMKVYKQRIIAYEKAIFK